MNTLNGIFVSLTTMGQTQLSPNELLYLGITSSDGNQEFVLDVGASTESQHNSLFTFSIGQAAALFGGRALGIATGHLAAMSAVTHVYLRRANPSVGEPSRWQLRSALVYLMYQQAPFRIFSTNGAENCRSAAHVWLQEVGHSGKLIQSPNVPNISRQPLWGGQPSLPATDMQPPTCSMG